MDETLMLEQVLQTIKEANKKVMKNAPIVGSHELCGDACEMAENISYHAVKGKFPKKVFEHRSPNQTEKEAEYIEKNYKQHTLPVFIDYHSTITRPFSDGNWAIDFRDDEAEFKTADKGFQKYIEEELPIYGSLEAFVKGILPTIKSIDANGFLAVRPKEIEYIQNDQEELVIDSTVLYEPTVFYFASKDVIDYDEEYYIFLSSEKSVVTTAGDKKEKTGSVYEVYTKNAVYFYTQIGKKSDNQFKEETFFTHNLDDCQVIQLKGIPNLVGDKILWQSPFLFATDLLDLVATNANFLQALINSSVFPVKVMFGSPCEFRDQEGHACQDGRITIGGIHSQCPSCNGIGLKSRISPLGTLLLNPSTKFNPDGEEKSKQDPLKYISPELHTLEFLRDKIEQDTAKARQLLHLQTSNSTTKGTENLTATGMVIDNKAMYAFVKPISDQIFSIYEFLLNAIGEQRYKEKFVPPAMTYPKTFDFKSAEDYLNDITNALKSNLPPSFIQLLLFQYINSYYGDNAKSTAIFKLVMSADRLFGLSQDEINLKLARGTVMKWEDILHTSILGFVNDSIIADPKFTEKTTEEQIKILKDLAIAKAAEISATTVSSVYNTP